MNSSSPKTYGPILAAFLSLIIPGAGQIYLKRTWRGITIFIATLFIGYLIYWGFANLRIGEWTIGETSTAWLWIPFALFALWNIYDAYRLARGDATLTWVGLVLGAVILYYLAWSVTDIKPERLITRFEDATKIMNELIHPDLFTRDESTGAISPSDNFGDIFGKMVDTPAPDWLAHLGLVAKEQKIPTDRPGTLIETIAIGLLATIFSTIFAIPVSFFAA
ncbi:MAG: hypothetical protein KGJ80_10995, partial [Chloroflexota bacterium]|nr:hypothetical protein [Chloroflexota bacterium]